MIRNAIVFGRGSFFRERQPRLENKFRIVYCIDNSVFSGEYDEDLGLYVYPTAKVMDSENEVILCMSRSDYLMKKQLLEMGISEERIYLSKEVTRVLFEDYKMSDYEKIVNIIQSMPVDPADRIFGQSRGTAVDRYYIDGFINQNKEYIKGNVIEIGAMRYAKPYLNQIDSFCVLHKKGWGNNAIKGDLETGEGIPDGTVDCFICPQTMQYIFNLPMAIKNVWKMLNTGGVALITVPGIKSISILDNDNWEDLWSFTEASLFKLCQLCFSEITISSYGNAKVSAAYLYGICQEDLSSEDLQYSDQQYPFILTALIKK